jgi:hypothetical protein
MYAFVQSGSSRNTTCPQHNDQGSRLLGGLFFLQGRALPKRHATMGATNSTRKGPHMQLLAVLILLGLGIDPAFSAEWLLIEPGQCRRVFVNPESISTKGAYRKAWFRMDYEKDQYLHSDPSKGYRSSKRLMYFNCQDRTVASVQAIFYSEPLGVGALVGSESVDSASATFTDVAPETLGQAMPICVCV